MNKEQNQEPTAHWKQVKEEDKEEGVKEMGEEAVEE